LQSASQKQCYWSLYYDDNDNRNNNNNDYYYYDEDERGDDYYPPSSRRGGPSSRSGGGRVAAVTKMLKNGNRKVGFPVLGAGAVFTILGASLFFNKPLMRLGNLCFVAGVPLTIGPGRAAGYFLKREKARATGCLAAGIFLVLVGWPVLGIALEVFGLLNLFGNMFPIAMALLKTMPVIGPLLRGESSSSGGKGRRSGGGGRGYDDDDGRDRCGDGRGFGHDSRGIGGARLGGSSLGRGSVGGDGRGLRGHGRGLIIVLDVLRWGLVLALAAEVVQVVLSVRGEVFVQEWLLALQALDWSLAADVQKRRLNVLRRRESVSLEER